MWYLIVVFMFAGLQYNKVIDQFGTKDECQIAQSTLPYLDYVVLPDGASQAGLECV
jgi:hypothetical protein